jgi:putative ABC transport system permease protein
MRSKLYQRVRSLLRRRRCERELDVELQFHLDMLTAQHIRAGMAPDAARRAAIGAFGAVAGIKDDVRDTWLSRTIEAVLQDVRHGLRMLGGVPAFTIGVVLTIALAVGVNTSIFGIAYSILLKPLPFHEPGRLVVLKHGPVDAARLPMFSPQELHDYRQAASLEAIAELHTMWFILLGKPADALPGAGARAPERVSTGVVSANYFDLLGIRPLIGRGFEAADDDPEAPAVLLLSHEYWIRAFDGDPSIVGRVFAMNDRPHTVVGVLPAFPAYPEPSDVYMPTAACPFRAKAGDDAGRDMRMGRAIARVREGVSQEHAASDLAAVASTMSRRFPATYGPEKYVAEASPLSEELRRELRPTLLLLVAAAGLVLLIACVSVSNLMLARLTQRSGEVSLRAALGASRGRLVRQLLTENVAVVAIGAATGLIVSRPLLAVLAAYVQRGTALEVDRHLNLPALVTAVGVSTVLLAASAALPLLDHRGSLNAGIPRLPPRRVRRGLIVSQVGLSFVLTIAASLCVRSVLHLQGIDAGFSPGQIHTLRLDLNFTKYHDAASISGFWWRLEERLAALPGVTSAGGAGIVPFDGQQLFSSEFHVEKGGIASDATRRSARPAGAEDRPFPRANLRVASPGYFRALGQPLREGRTFTHDDSRLGRLVVVINASLARRHWPGATAVGQRLQIEGLAPATVVGVVEDTRQRLDQVPGDEIYLPLLQTGQLSSYWLLRSASAPAEIERQVRAAVSAIDPEQPVDAFRSLESLRDDSLLPSRVVAGVVGLFSVLALLMTATGIAGIVGFTVQHRQHEFSVRLAFGARRANVVGMVVGDGLRLVGSGLLLGAIAAAAVVPLMRAPLAGIDRLDPLMFALASLALLVVATFACLVPARRAATVDPLLTLRAN